jgi:putative oxidoreductase
MKWMSIKYSENGLSFGLFVIRVVTGFTLAFKHGIMKLQGFNDMLAKGFPDPFHIGMKASLGLTIFAELLCSVLVMLGLFTRFATLPLIIAMSVALFMAHHGQLLGDGELAGIYLAVFVALLFTGPGKYSMDKLIGK